MFKPSMEPTCPQKCLNIEPKSMPKSIPGPSGLSGGPRDARSSLLETILVPFWCQIGSIWELRSPPGTSKSFQQHPKTTFRFTDPLQPHVRPIFLKRFRKIRRRNRRADLRTIAAKRPPGTSKSFQTHPKTRPPNDCSKTGGRRSIAAWRLQYKKVDVNYN